MRDYVLIAFVLVSLPVGLVLPYYALLVYAWLSYMYPQMYTFGFAQFFPSAKLTAAATVLGALARRDIDTAPLFRPSNVAMVLLFAWFTVSTAFAFYPDAAWARWQDVVKVILMALVASVLLTTRARLRWFLIVIAFSIAFLGIKGGLFSIFTGGEFMVGGAGTSVLSSNNAAGLALNMALPLMWYLAQEEQGWIKRLLQAAFLLSIPAIMFTYSRASAITLGVILLLLLIRGRHAFALIPVFLIAGLLAVPYVPDKWWERQGTTLEYGDDASAMSRIDNWKISWSIALDHPLTGLGFESQTDEVFAKYAPEYLSRYGKAFNTHSIYFAMLASHGFPGFVLFMAMIGLTYVSCWRIRRRIRGRPDLTWCRTYCNIVTLSLSAFLVNGAFVNMEYFDLPYHLVAITACLSVICERAVRPELDNIVIAQDLSPVSAV